MDLQSVTVTDVDRVITVYSPKGRYTKMQNRTSYGLSLCMDGGRITYTQDGISYVEDRTHAVILPQGQSYSIHGDATGSFPVINFYTLEPFCDRVTVLEVRNADYLLKCFEELKKLSAMGGKRARMLSLLYEMLDGLSAEESNDILRPALRLLHESESLSGITNATLAHECKISEVYFRRLFRERMGISPKQYVLSLRLQRAKQLLAEGNLKIWAVADACGFETDAHFCRSFQKHLGMTPSEYRRKNQTQKFCSSLFLWGCGFLGGRGFLGETFWKKFPLRPFQKLLRKFLKV